MAVIAQRDFSSAQDTSYWKFCTSPAVRTEETFKPGDPVKPEEDYAFVEHYIHESCNFVNMAEFDGDSHDNLFEAMELDRQFFAQCMHDGGQTSKQNSALRQIERTNMTAELEEILQVKTESRENKTLYSSVPIKLEGSSMHESWQKSEESVPSKTQAKRWTHFEEVLFIGSVFLTFVEKGSLFPKTRKGKASGGYTKQCESDTFERVHHYFLRCKQLYPNHDFPERKAKALCRHFKQMKQAVIKPGNLEKSGFLPLLEEWEKCCGREMLDQSSEVRLPEKQRSNCWTTLEEIVLIGSVVLRFFSRGSMCTKYQRDCWIDVKELFDTNCIKFGIFSSKKRSTFELARQYKLLKKKHVGNSNGLSRHVTAFYLLKAGYRPDHVVVREE